MGYMYFDYISIEGAIAPLTAQAGADQSAVDTNKDGSEAFTLNASASTGDIASYVWSENGTEIATGTNATLGFALGTHTVVLTVTGTDGEVVTDTVLIAVTDKENEALVANAGSDKNVTATSEASAAKKQATVSTDQLLQAYLNPVELGGTLQVTAPNSQSTIEIYTLGGTLQSSTQLQGYHNQVSTKGLGTGMYIIRLRSGEQSTTQKLIIR